MKTFTTFIAVQCTYKTTDCAIMRNYSIIDHRTVENRASSKLLIPTLNDLLTSNNQTIQQISFIAVNQGPGPLTTLRTIISSINGISFAMHTPLVSINGLEALALQLSAQKTYDVYIALLNAFNNDVYFAIHHDDNREQGCENINLFLDKIRDKYAGKKILFGGNGTLLHHKTIAKIQNIMAHIQDPVIQTSSIEQIGILGLSKWLTQDTVDYLVPLYLKDYYNAF